MGLFKKKSDPVSQRAKAINQQIAAIEAEIKKLNDQAASNVAPSGPDSPVSRTLASASASASATVSPGSPHPSVRPDPPSAIPRFTSSSNPAPRLRSTAHPQRPVSSNSAIDPHEPVFEEVNQPPIKAETELPAPSIEELGTRKSDFASFWRRFSRYFRGPVTSNPKLVNYLAAGSIQGLQPLRYEKRVARNRFIVFAALLFLALWGLIAMLVSRR